MNKRLFLVCVFGIATLTFNPLVSGNQNSLAQRVFNKHSGTLQHPDIRAILPAVLAGLKDPETQYLLTPATVNLVVANPDLLPRFIPDIEPKFVSLLKKDAPLKAMLRDPLMQRLLQDPVAIDELAGLLSIREAVSDVTLPLNRHDVPAQQIYDEAIHSVVWIVTYLGNRPEATGSGVLIDAERLLVVTNEHVIEDAQQIYVFFPWRNADGINMDQAFYLEHRNWLETRGYATRGRVIEQNVKNDLTIVQLADIPATAREIKHDFSRNVENSMKRGDTVHIFGNPGIQLWDWDPGKFIRAWRNCPPSGGTCLEMEAGVRGGNSGGPVLNGQGMLIGIVTATNHKTMTLASPAKNVRALLNRVPVNLPPIPPPQIHPKRTFKIRNRTGVTVPYQIKWSNNNNWQSYFLETGYIATHKSGRQHIPQDYPKIRFDYIAGDGQRITYRVQSLESALASANVVPAYRFAYNQRGDQLDLRRDGFAAPALSTVTPNETDLLSNYPNPFNPETWIPYQLAKPAEVTVTIYTTDGTLVRTLALGHQPAGTYRDKSRAAYWDGKNELGEPVASGLYFYTLKAGGFTATRKMLIRK